jgi:hypothetical protein
VCPATPGVRLWDCENTENRSFDIAKDEKQKEKHATDQFFSGLLVIMV